MNGDVRSRWLLVWLAALTAGIWLAYLLTAGDAVLRQGLVHTVLRSAAVVSTALVSVAGLGALVLNRALRGAEGEPTAFVRVIVYGVLTFLATFLTLRFFGFDVRAVLATSAIVTAAVGFAMQPTLGSMISGFALHMDRVLRVGDGVMHEGQFVEITSLNWRTVTGRTDSGRLVVFPNARMSDTVMFVAPYHQAMEEDFHFLASVDARPDWISDLVNELMVDLPLVEESLPIVVAPVDYEPAARALKYRVKYWIRRLAKADDVEAEAQRRIWYVFQRNRIAYPVQVWPEGLGGQHPEAIAGVDDVEKVAWIGTAVIEGDLRPSSAERLALTQRLFEGGELLLFATDEYMVMPAHTEGWTYLMVRGEAEASGALETLHQSENSAGARVQQLGRTAAIKTIADSLAVYIGPYAEYAVSRAARTANNLIELCQAVAVEIADPLERARFLREVCPQDAARVRRGAVLTAQPNAAGSLILGGGLRAWREVAVLAVPPQIDLAGPGAVVAAE